MSIAVVYLEKGLRTKQNTQNNRMKDNGIHKSHLRFQMHQNTKSTSLIKLLLTNNYSTINDKLSFIPKRLSCRRKGEFI